MREIGREGFDERSAFELAAHRVDGFVVPDARVLVLAPVVLAGITQRDSIIVVGPGEPGLYLDRLREERGIMLLPGDVYGMDNYIRIGIGAPAHHLEAGLERLAAFVRTELA